ncbi:hypothetical protein GGX14DRAFT_604206 [Mycena pura]|uniref:Alpha-type protein kinase domain-containing protein n=1 Tax=Mycena pura TaxID=153505 RepID=A0AAD6Y1R2_9AGAR|nr:hypothetical protein GGX14DRAFT_604206 [Mycena pura]
MGHYGALYAAHTWSPNIAAHPAARPPRHRSRHPSPLPAVPPHRPSLPIVTYRPPIVPHRPLSRPTAAPPIDRRRDSGLGGRRRGGRRAAGRDGGMAGGARRLALSSARRPPPVPSPTPSTPPSARPPACPRRHNTVVHIVRSPYARQCARWPAGGTEPSHRHGLRLCDDSDGALRLVVSEASFRPNRLPFFGWAYFEMCSSLSNIRHLANSVTKPSYGLVSGAGAPLLLAVRAIRPNSGISRHKSLLQQHALLHPDGVEHPAAAPYVFFGSTGTCLPATQRLHPLQILFAIMLHAPLARTLATTIAHPLSTLRCLPPPARARRMHPCRAKPATHGTRMHHTHGDPPAAKKMMVLCDVQTMKQRINGRLMNVIFDPMVHSPTGNRGPHDHGKKGIANFVATHVCNIKCNFLRLEDLDDDE